MSAADRLWIRFFHAAAFFAVLPGFAVGGALFLSLALGLPGGGPWLADARVHGHAEVFGWAGLLVLGVSYHFVPRLRGAPLASPRLASASLWLLVAGLAARLVLQSSLAPSSAGALLPLAGAVEVAGATLALVVLARTFSAGPPLASRPGFERVRPLLVVSFAALWLSLALDLSALAFGASGDPARLASWARRSSLDVAFTGFLVPIGVAMSARTFPLYLRSRLPNPALLRIGLWLTLAGLAARLLGQPLSTDAVVGVGEVLGGAALVAFTVGLGVYARRRPSARTDTRRMLDPVELAALAAYGWLALAALIYVVRGAGDVGVPAAWGSLDAARHAIGAGYVTLLIYGVGARLLPGFANLSLRDVRLVWAALGIGFVAVLLRVIPELLAVGQADALLASAGALGLVGVVCFWWSVPATARDR